MTEESKTSGASDVTEKIQHLEKQLQNWQAKATDYEKRFKDIDPEKYKALEEENRILQRENAGDDKEKIAKVIEKEKADLQSRFEAKFGEFESIINKLSERNKRLEVVNPTMQKAAEVFNADALPLIEGIIANELASADTGEIYVKDEAGKAKPSKKDPRKNMDLGEYLEGLAEKYPSIAKARGKSGVRDSGTSKGGAAETNGITVDKFLTMSEEQRRALPAMVQGKLARESLARR